MHDPASTSLVHDPLFRDRPAATARGAARKVGGNPWNRLSGLMELTLFILLIVCVYRLFAPEIDRQNDLISDRNQLEVIRDAKQLELEKLRQEHRLLKTDRQFLDSVARDRLDLQFEGEHVIRLERETRLGNHGPVE